MARKRSEAAWRHGVGAVLLGLFVAPVLADEVRPGVVRTPDARFENLAEYPFEPHYLQIQDYRVHYLDEGPADGRIVLLLHGEPTWSYLYRKMIPELTKRGHRCLAPDLVGFGKSDKPTDAAVHTYAFHVAVITRLIERLEIENAYFFGQDWGGLIGLRVVAENPNRFAGVVIANTALPTGEEKMTPAFAVWKVVSKRFLAAGDFEIGKLVAGSLRDPNLAKAYDAPFPDARYKAGPLIMPQRVPVTLDDPARPANLAAWQVLRRWEKPFVTAFGDKDPVTAGLAQKFQDEVPGAAGREHPIVKGAGHFLQETHAPQLAEIIDGAIRASLQLKSGSVRPIR